MKKRDEYWWAFLDGEISPAESNRFEQLASPNDRQRLADDLAMENEIAEILNAPVACPEAAWQTALARIQQHENAQRAIPRRRRRYLWFAAPLAAMAAIVFYLFLPRPAEHAAFLSLNSRDVSELAAQSQVNDGAPGVRAFMNNLALPVKLNPADSLDGQQSPYRLVGACSDQFQNEQVIRLFFDCNREPAAVLIVKNGGFAAQEIGRALATGTVRASRAVSDMLIAVVGQNAPRELIGVVDDHWPDPEPTSTENSNEAAPLAQMSTSDISGQLDNVAPQDTEAVLPVDEPAPTESAEGETPTGIAADMI